MNIEQMAQAYILNEIRRIGICAIDNKIILDAWSIAARMQAEADKRQGGVPEAILKASNSRGLDIEGMLHDIDDYFDQAECTKTPRMANNLLAQIYEQLSGEVKVPEMEAERHALRGDNA